jgi:3-hydroxy-5-methyl-1-naphthoate 3-O-methyltransferase
MTTPEGLPIGPAADVPVLHDLRRAPRTDPILLYRSRDEIYALDMLVAAVAGLDFFTGIDTGPRTVEDIARHFALHHRPVDVMTTLFVAQGLLARDGATLRLTETAREHLLASSPWFLGPYLPKLADRPIARDLLGVLRTDQPAHFASRKEHSDWHRAMEAETFAEEFTATMDCRGLLLGQALATHLDLRNHQRLLDIAGGSGIYACSLAARFPHLRASVLEKPPVDRIAARAIEARGFSERVRVISGDMLDGPLPGDHDVHLFSNVLHDWDEPVVRGLLQASAGALPPGGLILVHEAFLNAEKTGPLHIAGYSVLLMHACQGRCYSVAEMESWLSESGFETVQHVPSAVGRSALVARKT